MPTSRVPPILTTLLLTLLSQGVESQIISARQPRLRDQWMFGGSLFAGIPVGEFRHSEDGGGGGQLMVGFQPFRRQPLVVRAQVGSLMYGTASANGYQNVCDATSCWTEQVRYNARNHTMTFLQMGPEFMATDGKWRPFGYALAGYTFFNSWANLKPTTPTGTTSTESLFSSHNFSTSYGAGVRRVGTTFGREAGWEFAGDVTRNAKARYLTEQGLTRRSDGTWDISPRTGAANVLGIHIGFWVGPYINWSER
jgi:hypothetical protein